jgi:lysozyme family protein
MTLATVRAIDPVAAWAIARTLPLEGGLVDNPHDPGGVTDHGVSLRWALAEIAAHPDEIALFDIDHDGVVDAADIRGLTPTTAADIYFTAWWKPGWYGRLRRRRSPGSASTSR